MRPTDIPCHCYIFSRRMAPFFIASLVRLSLSGILPLHKRLTSRTVFHFASADRRGLFLTAQSVYPPEEGRTFGIASRRRYRAYLIPHRRDHQCNSGVNFWQIVIWEYLVCQYAMPSLYVYRHYSRGHARYVSLLLAAFSHYKFHMQA